MLLSSPSSRAGVAAMVTAGVVEEMAPGEGPATTGVSPRKEMGLRAGTAIATGLALDVGANRAEPTPAAVTPGWGVGCPIHQTRAPRTRAPAGETMFLNPTPRTTARVGWSRSQ